MNSNLQKTILHTITCTTYETYSQMEIFGAQLRMVGTSINSDYQRWLRHCWNYLCIVSYRISVLAIHTRIYNRNIITCAPPVWIVSLILSIVVVYAARTTDRGYRFSPSVLPYTGRRPDEPPVGIGIHLITELLATHHNTRYMQQFEQRDFVLWHQPSAGRIIGTVVIHDDSVAVITDITQQQWAINTEYLLPRSQALVQDTHDIRIIGIPTSQHTFTACIIAPHHKKSHQTTTYISSLPHYQETSYYHHLYLCKT